MNNLIEFLKDNFLHVMPILLAAGAAIAIMAERFRALVLLYPLQNRGRFMEKIRDMVMADRLSEGLAMCEQYRSKLLVGVIREGLMRAHQPEALLQDGLELAVNEAVQKTQMRTPYLATIANVSTLMGLFGTIIGLIQSFTAVGSASAQQRSALLAAGISTAMNATMLGHAVAIPCMVAYSFLMSRTNKLTAELEQTAIRFQDIIRQRYFAVENRANGDSKGRV